MKKKEEEGSAAVADEIEKLPETIEEWAEAVRRGDATAKQALAAYDKAGLVVLVALKYPTMTVCLEPEDLNTNVVSGKLHTTKIAGRSLMFKRNKAAVTKEDYKKYLNNGNINDPRSRFYGIDFMEEGEFREKIRHPANRKWALKVKENLTERRQIVDQKPKEDSIDFETIMEEFHPKKIGGVVAS